MKYIILISLIVFYQMQNMDAESNETSASVSLLVSTTNNNRNSITPFTTEKVISSTQNAKINPTTITSLLTSNNPSSSQMATSVTTNVPVSSDQKSTTGILKSSTSSQLSSIMSTQNSSNSLLYITSTALVKNTTDNLSTIVFASSISTTSRRNVTEDRNFNLSQTSPSSLSSIPYTKVITGSPGITSNNLSTTAFVNSTSLSTSSSSISSNKVTTPGITPSVITGSPVTGKYSSRVKMECSFQEPFQSDYSDIKSKAANDYCFDKFQKFSQYLLMNSLQLWQIVFYSLRSGSVLVTMEMALRSDEKFDDATLLAKVVNATKTGFSGMVSISSISISMSSTPVTDTPVGWIVGLTMAAVVALILMIIAIVLYKKRYPNACSTRSANNAHPQMSSGNATDDDYELEYYNVAKDDHRTIFNRNSIHIA